ncbi:MAG: hypothetical protein IIC72_12205 [Acidobacteria bacterium]|nr:hypothetical protein [Acidobacteriota bacterium]
METEVLTEARQGRSCHILTTDQIGQTGEIAGIRVLHVGHRLLVPAAPLRAALGLDEESDDGPE